MDEILEKISHGINSTVQKVELYSQITRIRIQIKKIERELNAAFKQIGKKVFRLINEEGYEEVKKGDIQSDMDAIHELKEKVHQLREKIADLQSQEVDEEENSDIKE